MQYRNFIPITWLPNDQHGERIQKAKRSFLLFYRIQICYIFTVSTQAEMFVVLFFAKIAYAEISQFFLILSLPRMQFEKNMAPLNQQNAFV